MIMKNSRTKNSLVLLGATILGMLLVGGAVAGTVWYSSPILQPFPDLTGPHQVGITTFMWTDTERTETYASNPDEKRSLVVRVWYPADTVSLAKPYTHFGQKLPYLQKAFSAHYGLPEWVGTLLFPSRVTHAYVDAPLSTSAKSYPVILFFHGLLGVGDMSVSLLEELASNGYIVVAIDQPYFNFLTLYPNGTVVTAQRLSDQFAKASAAEQKEFQTEAIAVYKKDMKFVLDRLTFLSEDQATPFYHKLCLDRVGIMGHSAGGTAAIEFCRSDKHCKAVVNLDGWYDQVIGYEPFTTPTLLLFGQTKEATAEPTAEYLKRKNLTREQYYERERTIEEHKKAVCEKSAECSMVMIPGASHEDFGDGALLKWPLRSIDAPSGSTLLATINGKVLHFFNTYLMDGSCR